MSRFNYSFTARCSLKHRGPPPLTAFPTIISRQRYPAKDTTKPEGLRSINFKIPIRLKNGAFPILREMKVENTVSEEGPSPTLSARARHTLHTTPGRFRRRYCGVLSSGRLAWPRVAQPSPLCAGGHGTCSVLSSEPRRNMTYF